MLLEAIKLFAKVRFDLGEGRGDGRSVAVLNLEAAAFGYTFAPDLIAALTSLDSAPFRNLRDELLATLEALSGVGVDHRRLFNGFPYETPDQYEYFTRRVVGDVQNRLGLADASFTPLSCGHLVDRRVFEAGAFGVCPICQFGVAELSSPAGEVLPYEAVTPLKALGHLSTEDVLREAERLLARPSSLSADEKTFLRKTIAAGQQPAPPREVFRETLPFVYELLGPEAAASAITGVTDILRIACHLSDPEADLSLKRPTKFRISTRHKKALLGLLDRRSAPVEDMLRHRERWLRLGEKLNPGAAENRRRFPNAAAAFDTLRNAPKSVDTFARRAERGIRSRTIDSGFLRLMASRPGEFARKLDFMLREANDAASVADAFGEVAPGLTTKLLFDLDKYLASRGRLRQRVFLPKGAANRAQVRDDRRKPLPKDAVAVVRASIAAELRERLSRKDALGRVWIDPALADRAVPFNRRGDSSTILPAGKGSRYPFAGETIRLFVHWTGRIDVDLSVVLFAEDFAWRGHVAFTNLKTLGCTHSGDVQDAPKGASEFIDFEIGTLRAEGVRYVGASIISFRGEKFCDFPSFAGFMERDGLASGAVFEPQSVKFKFDLAAPATSHLPLIFDLKARQVVFADLASAGRAFGAVKGERAKHRALIEGALTMLARKPTLYDVAVAHAQARGEITEDKAVADTVFDLAWADGPGVYDLLD
jgi:hypothetical protein